MGSAHIIRTRSGIVPPKTAIYCGPHCGKLPSINATYARHKPTIMSGSVPQKYDVALQAHLNTLMFPRKFLIGMFKPRTLKTFLPEGNFRTLTVDVHFKLTSRKVSSECLRILKSLDKKTFIFRRDTEIL